jgi:hypothetical protein
MADWEPLIDNYEESNGDDVKIDTHHRSVPCRLCWTIFGRVRLTLRYCGQCKRAFCEGEHGSFRNRGLCVRCYSDTSGQLA